MNKLIKFVLLPIVFLVAALLLWDVYLFYILFFGGLFILYYLLTPIEWLFSKIRDFAEGKHLD